jgi:hypothetical protein
MKKSPKQDSNVVKEYVRRLSDDDLSSVVEKLTQPICGDRADVSLMFEKDKDLDRWLSQCKGANDWFDKVDLIQDLSVLEISRRQKPKEKK